MCPCVTHSTIDSADSVETVPVGRPLSHWDGCSGLQECCVSLPEMAEVEGAEYLLMEGPMEAGAV